MTVHSYRAYTTAARWEMLPADSIHNLQQIQQSIEEKEHIMPLTSEQRDAVVGELKNIGASLNLSDDQKQKLQAFMTEASEKLHEYRQQNPNATQQDLIKKVMDNRATLRQRLVNFLTPAQLTKWDSEMANAKQFLGQKIAA